jgi:hypothetical protein
MASTFRQIDGKKYGLFSGPHSKKRNAELDKAALLRVTKHPRTGKPLTWSVRVLEVTGGYSVYRRPGRRA